MYILYSIIDYYASACIKYGVKFGQSIYIYTGSYAFMKSNDQG